MCDHCGLRDLTPIAALMSGHDRLRELTGLIRAELDTLDGADRDAMDRWEQGHLLSRPAAEGVRS